MEQTNADQPQAGDVVISEIESEQPSPSYWVSTKGRNSAATLFTGLTAREEARAAARERAGPGGVIWCYRQGQFQRDHESPPPHASEGGDD